jgi:hypothetical protein
MTGAHLQPVRNRPATKLMRRIAGPAAALSLLALLPGCIVAGVIEGAGTVAVAAVKTTGKLAGATAKAAGHVVASGVSASGDVASASVQTAAKLTKEGAVVFFDPQSGVVWETPWKEGLKLLAASQTAKVDAAFVAAKIIRKAAELPATGANTPGLLLESGDVVQLARRPPA